MEPEPMSGHGEPSNIEAIAPPPIATAPPIVTHFISVSARAFAFSSVVCGELQNVEYASNANVAYTPKRIAVDLSRFIVRDPYRVRSDLRLLPAEVAGQAGEAGEAGEVEPN